VARTRSGESWFACWRVSSVPPASPWAGRPRPTSWRARSHQSISTSTWKVPHTGPENKPGGWQEACVHARMRNFKTGQSAVCHFQPGVPIVVESRGRILPRDPKVVAAVAANRAARTILGGGTAPGIACDPFRKLMAKLMRDDGMPGARVAPCNGQVPAVYFDPER